MDEEPSYTAIDRALIEGASFVEARLQETTTESITVKNGELDDISSEVKRGLGVRVLVDGAMAFGSTTSLDRQSISVAVERAVDMAQSTRSVDSDDSELTSEEIHDIQYRVMEKDPWEDVDLQDKVGFLEDLHDYTASNSEFEADFSSTVLTLRSLKQEKLVTTSEGHSVESFVPNTRGSYLLTANLGGESIQRHNSIGGAGGWETLEERDFAGSVREDAAAMDRLLTDGQSTPTGQTDLVVSPEVAGIMVHEAVGHPFEADRVLGREGAQAGESYLSSESVGEEVGSPAVNVSDDPTIPGSDGYYLYDDEGVKARKRVLVQSGRVKGLLHNRETGSQMGVPSNASARATSYSVEPIVRMSNTFFEPGDYTRGELLEEAQEGVYMKSYTEWNIDDRRVNQRYTGMECYLIEDGEIGAPILNPVLETTTPKLLGSLEARGEDLAFRSGTCGKGEPYQPVPVWSGGPHLLFRDVNITTR